MIFFKAKPNQKTNNIEMDTEKETDELDDYIIGDQIKFWTEGASIHEQEESRTGSYGSCTLNPKILKDVGIILNRVAQKSARLIGNYTTNLAKWWMHIRTKFDGGKLFNHCSRGSWHSRCYAGGLRFNNGPKWSPIVWGKKQEQLLEKVTTVSIKREKPIHVFKSKFNNRKQTQKM